MNFVLASLLSLYVLVPVADMHAGSVWSQLAPLNGKHLVAEKQFGACLNCHGMPDPRVVGGNLWMNRVSTTACVQPMGKKSARLRASMLAYLQDATTIRPVLVTQQLAMAKSEGELCIRLAKATKGTLLLVPLPGQGQLQQVRLVFGADKKTNVRAIAQGRYRVQSYALSRKDAQGQEWQLWAAGAKGQQVKVTQGQRTELKLNDQVHVKVQLGTRGNKQQLGIAVISDSGMGATVIANGQRVAANYELFAQEGPVAKGSLAYG